MKTTLLAVALLCFLAWSPTSLADEPLLVFSPDLIGECILSETGYLEYWIETDKAVYMPGEQVRVVQGIRYVPGDPSGVGMLGRGVGYWHSLAFEHYIFSSDGERIDFGPGYCQIRPAFMSTVTLWPGDSLTQEWVWDLEDVYGNPVPPGTYDIYGGDSWVASRAGPVATITVVPEPASLMTMLGALSGLLLRRRRARG